MELDWIRIVAQILNFLLLVWLLQRFLFRPVATVMAAREERIRAGLEEGRRLQEQARAAETHYGNQLAALEQDSERVVKEAREAADALRDELLQKTRAEAGVAHRSFHAALEREKQEVEVRLQEEIIGRACHLAGQILLQLSGVTLEDRAVEVMLERLDAADDKELEMLRAGVVADSRVTVHAHRPLPEPARHRLARAITDLAGGQAVEVEFRTDPGLICGLRLSTTGATLDWNAAGLLREAEAAASRLAVTGSPSP